MTMDVQLKINNVDLNVNANKLHKMIFVFNALENGWTIKKKNKKYIFSKNHEKKREIFSEDYLASFIKDNSNINNLFS
jgi:hypothetical protein